MPEDASTEEEWPPREGRRQGAIWAAEGHIERREFYAAAAILKGFFDDEARGLHHLAAAGFKAQCGDVDRARRQLAHARRRLGTHALLARVERFVESRSGELAEPQDPDP
jgi:hypothetical protein